MLQITSELSIPESEVSFTASRSSGPGGQNVNKVSSRVTLLFDVFGSPTLSVEQKRRIAGALAGRMNKQGVLRVISQRTRSQDENRVDATERFAGLLRQALTPQRARVKSRPPAAAKKRRLEEKRKRRVVKQTRSKKAWSED